MSHELLIAFSALACVMVIALTALTGWQGWLSLKLRELDSGRPRYGSGPEIDTGSREGAARIEIADLKERIRKLEAIASGVDL
jgi:hypothetical protein